MNARTLRWSRIRWRLWAPIYRPVERVFARQRRRSINGLDLKPGQRVLIVGSGPGSDLPFLPPGLQITAIDLAPAMIRKLRRRAKKRGLVVDARVMDAQALAFPDGSFDAVIMHLVVAVVPDPVACVREAARVLRPGGQATVFDKFVPEGRKPPLILRLFNPVCKALATDITRQIGPLVAGSGLRICSQQPAGLRGLLRIIRLSKD